MSNDSDTSADFLEEDTSTEEDSDGEDSPKKKKTAKKKPKQTQQTWDATSADSVLIAKAVLEGKCNSNDFKSVRKAVPQVEKWIKDERYGRNTLDKIRRNSRKLIRNIHIYLITGNGFLGDTEFLKATQLKGRGGKEINGLPGPSQYSSRRRCCGATTTTTVVEQPPAAMDLVGGVAALDLNLGGGDLPFDQLVLRPMFTVQDKLDPVISYAPKRPLLCCTMALPGGITWEDIEVSIVDAGQALLFRLHIPLSMRIAKNIIGPIALEDTDYHDLIKSSLKKLPNVVERKIKMPFQCEQVFRWPDNQLPFAEPNNYMRRWYRQEQSGTVPYIHHFGKCCVFSTMKSNDDEEYRLKDRYEAENFTDFDAEPATPPSRTSTSVPSVSKGKKSSKKSSKKNRDSSLYDNLSLEEQKRRQQEWADHLMSDAAPAQYDRERAQMQQQMQQQAAAPVPASAPSFNFPVAAPAPAVRKKRSKESPPTVFGQGQPIKKRSFDEDDGGGTNEELIYEDENEVTLSTDSSSGSGSSSDSGTDSDDDEIRGV
ncbi:hypothetical protein SEMRO_80_G043170.1 [Seminavis robusta]|uniref:Uncharacterized protein n=1 Tax=Seminavis robusta TaxID=568900 RepID=A0A9N8H350_9STRA|nr:hypothetical protein SEMRO_80_G043170.1 [Seminavis robusta]|eukprot:Sro80_g043170.1 n/a (540) ;mRNA; r:78533-80745